VPTCVIANATGVGALTCLAGAGVLMYAR
jgi:hypothetical protein